MDSQEPKGTQSANVPQRQEPDADIFKHTYVDVPDKLSEADEQRPDAEPQRPASDVNNSDLAIVARDIFVFESFKFELAPEMFGHLGDFNCTS